MLPASPKPVHIPMTLNLRIHLKKKVRRKIKKNQKLLKLRKKF